MAPRPRTRTNDPQALRGRILDAAAEAFQARGYHAASTHEIMRAAGVTGGAFHHHFPSKKSLGLAVIRDRVAAEVRETWIGPVAAASSAAEGVTAVCAKVADALDAADAVRGCPLNNLAIELSLADPEFRESLSEVFADWRGAIAERLRADGVGGDPDAFAALVVAAFSGAMAQAKADQSTLPLRRCAAELERVMRSS